MELEQLFEGVPYEGELPGGDVTLVTLDSRRAKPGAVFVCTRGGSADGHSFAPAALESGAALVVTDHRLGLAREVVVADTRRAYALLCHNYFGNPARSLKLVAVTGTNGKTTITYLLKQILEKAGCRCGLIGTIRSEVGDLSLIHISGFGRPFCGNRAGERPVPSGKTSGAQLFGAACAPLFSTRRHPRRQRWRQPRKTAISSEKTTFPPALFSQSSSCIPTLYQV